MHLDALGAGVDRLAQMLGAGPSAQDGRVGGDQRGEMRRLARRVENPSVVGAQPFGQRLCIAGVAHLVQFDLGDEHPEDDAVGTRLFGERIEQIPDGAASFAHFHAGQFAVLPDFVAVAHRIIRFGEHVDMDIDNGGIAQGPPCSHGAGVGQRPPQRRIHEPIT